MKVTQIDIKETNRVIEDRRTYYEVAEYGEMPRLVPYDMPPQDIEVKRVVYEIHKMGKDDATGRKTWYLAIRPEELKRFWELYHGAKASFDMSVAKAADISGQAYFNIGRDAALAYARSLPWWKRLFKKF